MADRRPHSAQVGASPSTTPDVAEWEAMARARTNPRAFEPIYLAYSEPVYRYCVHRLGEREAAEDAMARIFARALAKLPAAQTGSVRAWIFAIAHNEVIDAVRLRHRHRPLESALFVVDDRFDPEAAALDAEADAAVRVLLDRLTAGQRRVVELRLSGLTAPEVASVLGMGLSAVKMTQLRAYATLRDVLKEECGTRAEGEVRRERR